LNIQKLTRAEIEELQLKGLCYNCDKKYSHGHRCKEQKIFMVMIEDFSEEEVVVSPMDDLTPPYDLTPPSDPP
jgi:hypothetical protein